MFFPQESNDEKGVITGRTASLDKIQEGDGEEGQQLHESRLNSYFTHKLNNGNTFEQNDFGINGRNNSSYGFWDHEEVKALNFDSRSSSVNNFDKMLHPSYSRGSSLSRFNLDESFRSLSRSFRKYFDPTNVNISEGKGEYLTFICPNCSTVQRQFFR